MAAAGPHRRREGHERRRRARCVRHGPDRVRNGTTDRDLGSDGRFTFEHGARRRHRSSFVQADLRNSGRRSAAAAMSRWCCSHPRFSKRSSSRRRVPSSALATSPASVSVVTSEQIAVVAGRRGRRCAAQVPSFSLFRRANSVVAQPDHAGRLAARHRSERPEPDARPARRRAVQRSVRRMGLLDARAARQRRSHRSDRRHRVGPLRQLRHGRRHQHRHEPAHASYARAQAAVRQPTAARSSTSSPATSGRRSGSRSKAAPSTPTGSRRCTTEAGPVDNNAKVDYRNITGKVEYLPSDRLSFSGRVRVLQGEPRQRQGRRGERHEVDEPQRRRPRQAARPQRPPGARVRRHPEGALQLPCGDVMPRRRATSSGSPPTSRCRSTASAAWCSGRRSSARSRRSAAGADWRWVDGDSQEDAYGLRAVPCRARPA